MAKWSKGMKKIPGSGRKPGQKSKFTEEMRDYWLQFFSSDEYRDSLKKRLLRGKSDRIEQLLLHYVYGKPVETVELTGEGGGPVKITGLFTQEVIEANKRAKARQQAKHGDGNGNGAK